MGTKAGNIEIGNQTDYMKLTQDGARLVGDATQWDDLRVPVLSTKTGGTKDPNLVKSFDNGSGSQGVFTYYFDASTEEELYFAVQLPHAWAQGTNIHAHVHWFPSAAGTAGQVVSWGLEYTWANIGGDYGNTTIEYGNAHFPNDSELAADRHYITEIADIDGTGKTFSSMLLCRVFRDATGAGATDDYASDAGLLEVDFHFEVDSFGSVDEYVKY